MFLIDKPYASDFLIKTIREHKYPIVSSPVARELITDDSLAWISEEEAIRQLNNNPETPLYSNSENALAWIAEHLGDSELAKHVRLFKDKAYILISRTAPLSWRKSSTCPRKGSGFHL